MGSSLGEASARIYCRCPERSRDPDVVTRLRRIKAALNAAERGDVRWCAVLKLDVEEA